MKRWISVEATIVECGLPPRQAPPRHGWPLDIVADIKLPDGQVERVRFFHQFRTRIHHWRPLDPGEVVPAEWSPELRAARLKLGSDPRYDQKLIDQSKKRRAPGTWP
jgi:hypothetical protein